MSCQKIQTDLKKVYEKKSKIFCFLIFFVPDKPTSKRVIQDDSMPKMLHRKVAKVSLINDKYYKLQRSTSRIFDATCKKKNYLKMSVKSVILQNEDL